VQHLESELADANARLQHLMATGAGGQQSMPQGTPGTVTSPLRPRQMAELLRSVVEVDNQHAANDLQRRLSSAVANLTALGSMPGAAEDILAHRDCLRAGLRMLQERMGTIARLGNSAVTEGNGETVKALRERLAHVEDELRVREAHINALNARLHASTAASSATAAATAANSEATTSPERPTASDMAVRREVCALLGEVAGFTDVSLLSSRLDALTTTRRRGGYGRWAGGERELDACINVLQARISSLSEIERLKRMGKERSGAGGAVTLPPPPAPTWMDSIEGELNVTDPVQGLAMLIGVIRETEGCQDVDLLRRKTARLKARLETIRDSSGGRLTWDVVEACGLAVGRQQRLSRELVSLRKLTVARSGLGGPPSPTSSRLSSLVAGAHPAAPRDARQIGGSLRNLGVGAYDPASRGQEPSSAAMLGLHLAPRDPGGVGSMVL